MTGAIKFPHTYGAWKFGISFYVGKCGSSRRIKTGSSNDFSSSIADKVLHGFFSKTCICAGDDDRLAEKSAARIGCWNKISLKSLNIFCTR